MNIKFKVLILVGLIVLGVVGYNFPQWLIKRDLNKLCELSEQYLPKIMEDPAAGMYEYSENVGAQIYSKQLKEILSAFKKTDNSMKLKLFKQGLQELGNRDWSCPAFNKIYIE